MTIVYVVHEENEGPSAVYANEVDARFHKDDAVGLSYSTFEVEESYCGRMDPTSLLHRMVSFLATVASPDPDSEEKRRYLLKLAEWIGMKP